MAKKNFKLKIGNYDSRGEKFGEDFMKRMPSYPYLIEYSKDEKNGLDVQLRGKYINIYYQGGNLIKLSGLQTCEFDENYFYLPEKDGLPMTDIERLCHKDYVNKAKESKILKHKTKEELDELRKKAFETKGYIKGRRDELVNILKNCDSLESVRLVVEEMKNTIKIILQQLVMTISGVLL